MKIFLLILCLNIIIVQNIFSQEIFLVDTSKVSIKLDPKQSSLLNSIRKRPSSAKVALIKSKEVSKLISLNEIGIEIFDKGIVNFKSKYIRHTNVNTTIWTGEGEGNNIILVFIGEDIIGSITIQHEKFKIEPLGAGLHVLIKFDETKLPPEHPEYFEMEFLDTFHSNRENRPDLETNLNKLNKVNNTTTIDVLVAYTQSAANASGNIQGLVQLAIIEANQSYSNSNISLNLNLVCSVQVDYTESGNFYTDRDRFVNPSDGYMDNIHLLRNQYSADVCVLIINNDNYCGLAADILANEATAFCVVHYDCATGYYSFAHEIGHLQGARHDRGVDPNETPFRYGHGFIYPSGHWRTIMAYPTYCSNCTRIQYWSNPDKTYNGITMGTEEYENNARVLNETSNDVANFRVLPSITSGTLSTNETWYWNTLTGSVFIPSGITLTLGSGGTINLNGYSIISTGGIINIEDGATINGLRAKLKNTYSSTYKGLFSTVQAAIDNASQLDEIHIVGGPYNENLNITNKNSISIYSGTINGTITATNSPGLQIFGTECNAIYLNNCTFPVFNNVNIYGNGSGTGLSLYNTDYNPGNMFNTMVWNFSTGFYASNSWCYLNSGNIFYENSSAIVSAYNSNLSLYYNELCNISGYHLTAGYGGYIYALGCYYDNGIPRIFQNYGTV